MANHEVLTPSQRDTLIKGIETLTEHQIIRYFKLSEAELTFIHQENGQRKQMGLAVQLCFLRYPGRPFEVTDTLPDTVLLYIARQVGVVSSSLNDYVQMSKDTLNTHLQTLQTHFGFRKFTAEAEQEMKAWLLPLAMETDSGLTLLTGLTEAMRQRQMVQPRLSVLEEFVWQTRREAQQTLFQQLTTPLPITQYHTLSQLVEVRSGTTSTYLTWLQEPPGEARPTRFLGVAERLTFLRDMELPAGLRQTVPPSRLVEFAREGAKMTAQRLKNEKSPELLQQYYAWLVAFCLERITLLTDQALQMSDDLGGRLFSRSEHRRNQQFQTNAKAINAILHSHSKSGKALIGARTDAKDPYAAIQMAVGWEKYLKSVEDAQKLAQPEGFDPLDHLDNYYSAMRRYTPTLMNLFDFKGTQATEPLREAIELLQHRNQQEKPPPLPDDAPTDFVKPRWEDYVYSPDGTLDPHYYEFCVFSELRDQLRSGDMWVPDSKQFKDFEADLIPKATWATMKQTNTIPLAINTDFKTYMDERKQQVKKRMREVNDLLASGQLSGVTLVKERLHIERLDALELPDGTEDMAGRIHKMLPAIRITELIQEVLSWVAFDKCFTHERTGQPVPEGRALLAVILADALNVSVDKMAQACPELQRETIVSTAQWYMREETYAQALSELVSYHRQLPFVIYWGDGTTSASDAQFFATEGRRSALAHISRHYGFDPGIFVYTHYSDQHESFHIAILSPHDHQAPYAVDGLVAHRADMPIREHYTDTGGVSDIAFAMLHLMGYGYAPRMRDIRKRKLHIFEPASTYPALASLIGDQIKEKQIETHWDDILRATSSIEQGFVRATVLMKKLSAYPRQNNLASALKELGQIERTLFTLDWLQYPELRRRVLLGLQKVEWKHALARVVFAHRRGSFQEAEYSQQLNRASGLNLVIMCIIIWNTVYMARAVEQLRQAGVVVSEAILPHVSPLQWEHINFLGDFIWNRPLPALVQGLRALQL